MIDISFSILLRRVRPSKDGKFKLRKSMSIDNQFTNAFRTIILDKALDKFKLGFFLVDL